MLKGYVKTVVNKLPNARSIVKFASSPQIVAVTKVVIAVITLCQALDGVIDTKRTIGFKR